MSSTSTRTRSNIRTPVDRHGLKLYGLRKACTATRSANYRNLVQVSYDMETDTLLTSKLIDSNSLTRYASPSIVFVTVAVYPLTMQEIADRVYAVKSGRCNYFDR